MKQFLLIAVVLCGLQLSTCDFYDEDEYAVDYRLYGLYEETITEPTKPTEPKKNCTKPGMMCQTCQNLVNCVKIGSDFEAIDIETCEKPDTCLQDRCTNLPNPECSSPYPDFKCTATGAFPDPANCRKYHFCALKDDSEKGVSDLITLNCGKGFGYDPISTYCKNNLLTGSCPANQYPVPICNKAGQTGPLINRSIYYVCVKNSKMLYPMLYLCPNGGIYENNTCVAK